MQRFPNAPQARDARARLVEIAFQRTKRVNTIDAYEAFLKNCNTTSHAPEIRERMGKLQVGAIKKLIADINAHHAELQEAFSITLKAWDRDNMVLDLIFHVPQTKVGAGGGIALLMGWQTLEDVSRVRQQQQEINAQWIQDQRVLIHSKLHFVKAIRHAAVRSN